MPKIGSLDERTTETLANNLLQWGTSVNILENFHILSKTLENDFVHDNMADIQKDESIFSCVFC